MKSNAEINVDHTMRNQRDVVAVNNSVVVFRYQSISIHSIDDKTIEVKFQKFPENELIFHVLSRIDNLAILLTSVANKSISIHVLE